MKSTRFTNRALASLVAVAAMVAMAACGGEDSSGGGGAVATTTTTAAEPSPAVEGLDFAAGSDVDLGDGWRVVPCESGPPLFCARRSGSNENESVIELIEYPTSTYTSVKDVLGRGGSTVEALRAHAAEFHDVFEKERPTGCGASYRVEPFGPEEASVAGRQGIVYGFDGHAGSRHVERALQFATIRGDMLAVIATSAIEDDTCMDDGELGEFTIAELEQLEPTIIDVIATSTLP